MKRLILFLLTLGIVFLGVSLFLNLNRPTLEIVREVISPSEGVAAAVLEDQQPVFLMYAPAEADIEAGAPGFPAEGESSVEELPPPPSETAGEESLRVVDEIFHDSSFLNHLREMGSEFLTDEQLKLYRDKLIEKLLNIILKKLPEEIVGTLVLNTVLNVVLLPVRRIRKKRGGE